MNLCLINIQLQSLSNERLLRSEAKGEQRFPKFIEFMHSHALQSLYFYLCNSLIFEHLA